MSRPNECPRVRYNAGDEDVLAVADGVDLELGAGKVFVDEHGIFDVLGEDDGHIFLDIGVVKGDDHILPAQHVGGAHQHGITNAIGGPKRLFGV